MNHNVKHLTHTHTRTHNTHTCTCAHNQHMSNTQNTISTRQTLKHIHTLQPACQTPEHSHHVNHSTPIPRLHPSFTCTILNKPDLPKTHHQTAQWQESDPNRKEFTRKSPNPVQGEMEVSGRPATYYSLQSNCNTTMKGLGHNAQSIPKVVYFYSPCLTCSAQHLLRLGSVGVCWDRSKRWTLGWGWWVVG